MNSLFFFFFFFFGEGVIKIKTFERWFLVQIFKKSVIIRGTDKMERISPKKI